MKRDAKEIEKTKTIVIVATALAVAAGSAMFAAAIGSARKLFELIQSTCQ